jgi:hypothetical protein
MRPCAIPGRARNRDITLWVNNRMARKMDGQKGFLSRLLHNEAGNVLFMTAAFLIPLLGLVGGGVDMSRLYLAKTRLQQACDAGALAGRKAMGNGSWTTTGTGNTEARAINIFQGNFKDGDFGATGVTDTANGITAFPTYTESGGVVTGKAKITMPMMVIKVLGITTKSISVACTSKMEIPNTDVMFVIDNTGSMNCQVAHSGYSCPGGDNNGVEDSAAKMKGLRSAIKCFYEALAKIDTTENCGSTPSGTVTAQIRFGFMPYSVNVNVGKLLPNSFLADTWSYQSRTPDTTYVYAWTAGTETSVSWGSWPSNPSGLSNASTYSGWSNIATSGGTTVTINSITYTKRPSGYNSTTCPALNTLEPNTLLAYTYTTSVQTASATSTSTPTYPADTVQTLNYSQGDNRQAIGYRYRWTTSGGGSCRLQSSNTYNYTITRTGTSTKPLTWTQYPKMVYKQVAYNVSSLKAGGSTWNNAVTLPVGTTLSVKLSGSLSSSNIVVEQDVSVPWGGCIEERQTYQNTNSSTITTTDWNPIPATAFDTDFVTVPSSGTAGTQWGPILPNAVWARYTGTSTDTIADVVTTADLSRNYSYSCPYEARKLQVWSTASSLETYLGSLFAIGNTYHDIGMVWGARFISPTGIFASENAATPSGQPIQRHIVFMTDGDTMTTTDNYSAYGVTWWDRRQTSYAPSSTNTNNIVNSRLTALCSAIKNQNITLWVVSYGGGTNTTTETRLQNCASTPNAPNVANTHYFNATDTTTLIAKFQQIAAEIADLRLIS